MSTALDLQAYFQRVGWSGATPPTYATLAGLLEAHMSAIPFENLDVLLDRPIRLDLESLQEKLVQGWRGGYCFEHATLFASVLEALGFALQRHSARVTLGTPRTESARTHMFLTVALPEGRFVVDPGFGALAPRQPLPLVDGAETTICNVQYWMRRDGPFWIMRAQFGDKATDAWASTLEPDNPVDFEMGNYFVYAWPHSPFVNNLMLRALTPDGRVGIMNRDMTIWHGNEPQKSQLPNRAALRKVLKQYFGFDLPEVEKMWVPAIPEWD